MTGFVDLNLKFPMILAISEFMSSFNFMLSGVEHEKSFITLGPGSNLCHFLTLSECFKANKCSYCV